LWYKLILAAALVRGWSRRVAPPDALDISIAAPDIGADLMRRPGHRRAAVDLIGHLLADRAALLVGHSHRTAAAILLDDDETMSGPTCAAAVFTSLDRPPAHIDRRSRTPNQLAVTGLDRR
jgi:hypothetical protein